MNRRSGLALSLLLGAAGGTVAALVVPHPGGDRPSESARAPRPSPELDQLKRRVDELAQVVLSGSREDPARIAEDATQAAPPVTTGTPPASLTDRVVAMEKRIAALESRGRGTPVPEDLSKLSSKELADLARSLSLEKRPADHLRVAETLVARGDLDADQRDDAELQVGYALRSLGRHAEAEARFRETLARVGENSEKGGLVTFQIGWERSFQQDLVGASLAMERAADNPAAHVNVRVQSLLRAAQFAKGAGDPARAHALAQRLLRDYGDLFPDSQPMQLRRDAEALLGEVADR